MRCLIVDDEAPARQGLRHLFSEHEDAEIVGEAADVTTALALTRQLRPDVVFLDVQMRGETGFDYVGRWVEPMPYLVFVTAYDSHAVRAFECNALDYLLKPVLPERLAEALARFRRQEELRRVVPEKDDRVLLKSASGAQLLPWKQISHIVAAGNYSRVFLEESSPHVVLRTLKDWSELFPPGLFLQVHRQVIVRRDAVTEYRTLTQEKRELVLNREIHVPVGRRYWRDVKLAFGW